MVGASLFAGETGGALMRRHRAARPEEPESFPERGIIRRKVPESKCA